MNRQVARGTAASIVYVFTSVLVSVFQLRILLQALPPETVGLWLLFLSIGAYVLFFDVAINPTVAREISFAIASPNSTQDERTLRIGELLTTVRYIFRITAFSIALFGCIIGEILIHASPRFHSTEYIAWTWAIFSLGAAANLLASTAFSALFGLGNIATEKLIRSVCLVFGFGLTLTALYLHTGVLGLSIAWCIQGILMQFLAWHQLKRIMPDFFKNTYRRNWDVARRLAAPCFNMAVVQLGAMLILQSANILIALLIGTRAIPSYEAVSKIALTLMTLVFLVINSATPFLSMAHASGRLSDFRDLLFHNLRFGLAIMSVLCAFVVVNGEQIIFAWLGPQLFASTSLVWILLLSAFLEVHHVIFATSVLATGKIAFNYTALIAGILNILFALLLTQRLGLVGIALALAVAQLLTNNWYAPYLALRTFHLPITNLIREVWLPICCLFIAQLAINFALRQIPWLGLGYFINLSANFLLSICIGGVIGWAFFLGSAERRFITEMLPNMMRPSTQ